MDSVQRVMLATYGRALAIVVATLLIAAIVAASSSAAGANCRVKNVRTSAVTMGTGSNLQSAITDADRGDTLKISGICYGTFRVGKTLTLSARVTDAFPIPTLDGRRSGSTLTVAAKGAVVIEDLRIRGGSAGVGAGISNAGSVTLDGTTRVTGNEAHESGAAAGIYSTGTTTMNGRSSVIRNGGLAYDGGGVVVQGGVFTMNDHSAVRGNHASTFGGGVHVISGSFEMNGSSAVVGNSSDYDGGGIHVWEGDVTILGSARVADNTAFLAGGGIWLGYTGAATLTLDGEAQVTGNSTLAEDGAGGGIVVSVSSALYLYGSASVTGNTSTTGGGVTTGNDGVVYLCSGSVSLSPNTPDDPPQTQPCT